ncbi:MAG: prepilin peptidase [bacterium]
MLEVVLLAGFLGACLGSFLNVCIYRLPLHRSLLQPGSHCAACGAPIRWYHNIPIVSWLWLKGRAACCGTRIDARYMWVEAGTAVGVAGLWALYPSAVAVVYTLFFCGLIVTALIDLDHFIVPDEFSLGGIPVGLVLSFFVPQLHGTLSSWEAVMRSGLGIAVGGGGLFLIAIIGTLVLKKEAMGLGDVKLMAAMGAFLGWQAVVFTVVVASFIGTAVGIVLLVKRRKVLGVRMPFGPSLALAAAIWLFFGGRWWAEHGQAFRLWPSS